MVEETSSAIITLLCKGSGPAAVNFIPAFLPKYQVLFCCAKHVCINKKNNKMVKRNVSMSGVKKSMSLQLVGVGDSPGWRLLPTQKCCFFPELTARDNFHRNKRPKFTILNKTRC